MAISCVHLKAGAYMVCLTHALSTEREEIMGLCIGEVDVNRVVHIVSVIMLRRSDKRKDRVEISPEQLTHAASQAERLALQTGKPLRVLGWYHSHPHITVWPSHVDVRTQAMYQMMDEGFVGLIFSCFHDDKTNNLGHVTVTCFQSTNQSPEGEPPMYERLEIPFHIVRNESINEPCLNALIQLPRILHDEEEDAYNQSQLVKSNHLEVHNRAEMDQLNEGNMVCDNRILNDVHNSAVFTKSVCHQLEVLTGPLMQCLQSRLEKNKHILESLNKEKESILQQLSS
ncbi:lys-63-specific deubiquitinase BRCC36-like [Antedon mediterranea]|uniref:lys-63-specific deubiquitinase BRCC36-like n=1 Tax=Antedon mediterranea TaxID=105859 RepID=UPI003AF4F6D8